MLRATAPAAASASASSLLPRHSRSTGRSSRWPRLLLCCGVLYVCGLLTFILYTRPSSSANEELSADQGTVASQVPSNRQSDAVAIAKAEEHARNVKMLPQNQQKPRSLHCVGWRATDDCSPHGPRLPHLDKPCHMMVQHTRSGYCEVEDRDTKERFRVMRRYCRSVRPEAQFRCFDAEDFVNFPLKAKEAVSKALLPGVTLPRVQGDGKGTKGIVMVVYPKMVPSAYASIRALREVLRCELPIELWYRPKEMLGAPGSMAPLQQLAAMADGRISFQEIDDKKATGFSAKVFAIYHSFFDQMLFLDSDNVPVRDPNFLFETIEYLETGAVFWPDFWHPRHTIFNIHGQSLVWELLDQPFVNMFEQESGQLVIDRRRHAAALELVKFYTFHTPNHLKTFELVHGDKDLFRLAWLKLKSPFHMIDTPPAVAGKALNNSFCGMTMVQHDANGEVLFLHRNTRKLVGEPKRQNVNLKTAAALRVKKKLLLTQPGRRTKPTLKEIEEELRNGVVTPLPTLDPPEADGYPDAAYWTHLLSFRNTSRRIYYKIDVHPTLDGFTKGQTCYGVTDMLEQNEHFYFQAFANFSFGGLEDQLRRFAMEAAQVVRLHQNDTVRH
uniref:Nucleotide-diphospho-sugar transferase domain-containing protein n=1 Tax=Phytophthora ramorum TaxID=164328 RepID=H3GDJ2_PHYRM